jgi:hypothetical protein
MLPLSRTTARPQCFECIFVGNFIRGKQQGPKKEQPVAITYCHQISYEL